jgi:hypothetical protein
MQKIDIMVAKDAEHKQRLDQKFKDALLLLNVHFPIGPKKWRLSYQLLAFILML